MSNLYVEGRVAGSSASRSFNFLIIKDTAHIGLPQGDIDSLSLESSIFTGAKTVGSQVFQAGVHFGPCYAELGVMPSPTPTVGVTVLKKLGFQVDAETDTVVSPKTPIKIYRGLMPSMLDAREVQSGSS